MKTKHFLFIAFVYGLAAGLNQAAAQGTAFTYQGRLNDGPNPANGTYDLRFTVCDALTNGNITAGPVTNCATPVANGLFSVTLDFGVGVFTGPGRWLQLDVRTNGGDAFTTLCPRQSILPVPHAILANSASNLLGTLPAAQLSGTLPATALAGYSGAVTLTNGGNSINGFFSGSFGGDGAGLSNITAHAADADLFSTFVAEAAHVSAATVTSMLSASGGSLNSLTGPLNGAAVTSAGQVGITNLPLWGMQSSLGPQVPQLGWSTWESFATNYNATTLSNMVTLLATNGMLASGYNWFMLDTDWASGRDGNGVLTNGYKNINHTNIVAHAHAYGFKVSVYEDTHYNPDYGYCPTLNTNYGLICPDLTYFMSLGIDGVKWDSSIPYLGFSDDPAAMTLAANAVRNFYGAESRVYAKPLFIDVSVGPDSGQPIPAELPLLVNSWEPTALDEFNDTMTNILSTVCRYTWEYAYYPVGPGHLTKLFWFMPGRGLLSATNQLNILAMWPSHIFGDWTMTNAATYGYFYTNSEILSIVQDPAVLKHRIVYGDASSYELGLAQQVWVRPLGSYSSGKWAVGFFNAIDTATNMQVNWNDLGISNAVPVSVRDPWAHADLGVFETNYSLAVPAGGSAMVVLTAQPYGNAAGMTNLFSTAIAGITNGSAPLDPSTIKAWMNLTLTNGEVFKMPLYQ